MGSGPGSGFQVPSLVPTGSWVRVLANECIKRLCPVHFHSNGSEYIMALTTGKREGYVHFGTITGKGGRPLAAQETTPYPRTSKNSNFWPSSLTRYLQVGSQAGGCPCEWGWVYAFIGVGLECVIYIFHDVFGFKGQKPN